VFLALQTELRDAWLSLRGQIARDEHVGAPVISAIFDLLQVYLDRRYARYALVLLPGRLREEVLANVARQSEELRVYFAAFNQSLADRCLRQDYAEQARFAGDRYLALLSPAMAVLLDGDNALGSALPRSSAGSGSAATGPAGARRNLLKTVSFEAASPATPTAPAAAAVAQPAAVGPTPPPASPGWPPYVTGPPPYYPGGGPFTFGAPAGPFSPPPHGAAAWGGFAGAPPGSVFPFAAPAHGQPGPSPPQRVKPDPGGGSVEEKPYLGQPQHPYVSGADCSSVPPGQTRKPACGCLHQFKLRYNPGPHATWDCPLRYISQCGSCPGFNLDGSRDPSQWQGDNLTRATKTAWLVLLAEHKLTVPRCKDARPPPFHL
jgi:hypothetical protein